MLADLLLILGILILTIAGFLASRALGLAVVGLALVLFAIALPDGKSDDEA